MRRFLPIILIALVAALVPIRAFADLRLTPYVGASSIGGEQKTTFGASITAGGLVSVELDASRAQLGRLVDLTVVDVSAHATTIMGNVVVRMPVGPVQPYVTGGGGLIRVTGDLNVPLVGSLFSVSAQDFGWNVGGGLYILPSDHFGVRADVRRFQTSALSWNDITGINGINDIPLPKFDFWRATAGITFRF
jgi:opacity protein-like surface antigen